MPGPKGCLKSCALGCAGFLALLIVGGVIISALVWRTVGSDARGSRHEAATTPPPGAVSEPLGERAQRLTTTRGGRVHLALGEGDFRLRPAAPGEGIHAHATFDSTVYRLTERFAVLPDSTWDYSLECGRPRAGSGLVHLFGSRGRNAKVTVYLPPEVPLDLDVRARRGGCTADLGGLWLRQGDLDLLQGGLELEFSSPLHEAMESLVMHSRMGGMAVARVGNASPRRLDVDCTMGGGDIDLRGAWRGDCEARAAVRMGGINLTVPAEMRVEGDRASSPEFTRPTEVPAPVLRLTATQKMGEVKVVR
jgi:hypothetical protein